MKKIILGVSLLVLVLSSCVTYQLPLERFTDRFENIDSTDLVLKRVKGPLGESYSYYVHPDKTIILLDKSGKETEVDVIPSLEMRVTHNGGKKSYFYFDKVYLTDKYLIGDRSRFSDSFKKKIELKSIEKIEVQDGKKNFKYY